MVWKVLLLLALMALPVIASAQAPSFKDKSVRVIVGFPPGGGSDAEGRVIARHLGKYIPGNPSLIVQNMPGAGGIIASNYFEDLAKADGLTLYYCVGSTAITQQAFGVEGVKYDMRGWEVLGSVDRASSVVLVRAEKMTSSS
jgi:tripartite-type tricarboxylate transporter receptor subunit TctC